MPRINTVKKARKAQGSCSKCGKVIAVGDAYKWIKPRYGAKRVACSGCSFSDSDLTSSEKLGQVYDARDEADELVSDWDGQDVEELRGYLQDAAEQIREVATEYQESADAIMDNFPSGNPTSEQCEENASELESYADALEDFEPESFEFDETNVGSQPGDDNHEQNLEDAKVAQREQWVEDTRQQAHDAVGECPL